MNKIIFIFYCVFCLSGCVKVPEHDLASPLPQVDYDPTYLASNEEYFPEGQWWESFGSPALNDLIATGLNFSPTLKVAEERLKAAYQVSIQTQATLYPQIDLEVLDTWYRLSKYGFFRAFAPSFPATVNDFTIGLSFQYEFDFWGKNRDLFKAALHRTVARSAERAQAELILTTSIAYTFTELQFLLLQKKILEKQKENEQGICSIRENRKCHAIDSKIETDLSELALLDICDLLTTVEREIALHHHKLKALIGSSQNAPLVITLSPLSPLSLPQNLPLDLIARRPDLVAQKALTEAAAKEIGAAKTNFYPNINLNALIGIETVFWSKLFNPNSFSATIAPALSLPIFTAGRIKAHLYEKVAAFNDSVYQYNQLILLASQEIADRLSELTLIQKEIEIRERSLKTSESLLHITKRRFDHALTNQISLLVAEDQTLKSTLTLAALEYSQLLETILLMRALGGGYHDGN